MVGFSPTSVTTDTWGMEEPTWDSTWRFAAGALGCTVLGWFAYVHGTRVPLLGLVDLGFHELGHLLTYWLPDVVTAAMGSITQVGVPIGLASYFLWGRQDTVAAAVCLAWAATSARDAAIYVADAPYQRLELIGGEHDWAFVLGPSHLNLLDRAHLIAAMVNGAGIVMLFASVGLCAYGHVAGRRSRLALRPASAETATRIPVAAESDPLSMWR
jgi:hypothetical protein